MYFYQLYSESLDTNVRTTAHINLVRHCVYDAQTSHYLIWCLPNGNFWPNRLITHCAPLIIRIYFLCFHTIVTRTLY